MSRFPFAMTVVTFGALAVSAAVMIGAYAVVDQHAAQVLENRPRAVPAAQKRAPPTDPRRAAHARGASQAAGSSAASRQTVGSAAAAVTPQQTMTGDTSDKKLRTQARHRGRHERRSARRHSQEPPSLQPAQQQPAQQPALPAPQERAQSTFFPFR